MYLMSPVSFHLSICPFVHLSICLFVYLSICLLFATYSVCYPLVEHVQGRITLTTDNTFMHIATILWEKVLNLLLSTR